MSEGKDKIYIDIDDEITAVIAKLKKSSHKIVALVLPKRATMLQSIVNMRLLKKAAKTANKNVVLITTEDGLLPLAGAAGLHVADSLTSKPKIPPIPHTPDKEITVTQGAEADEDEIDKNKSIGELAGQEKDEVIEVDNTDLEIAGEAAEEINGKEKKRQTKFKIPNFEKFRVRLMLILAGALLLIIGLIWGLIFAPKATVHIDVETTTVFSDIGLVAKIDDALAPDLDNAVLPAKKGTLTKSSEQKVQATGQKNIGNKAKGTLTLKNCTHSDGQVTIPAGTSASSGSFSFLTDEAVTLPASSFSGGGTCLTPSEEVSVTAKDAGGAYNLSARSYTLSGYSSVTASGNAMSGGTDQIVKVLSDKDISTAKDNVTHDTVAITEDLKSTLTRDTLVGISETLESKETKVTSVPNVGDEASEATVTVEITYSMLGVYAQDLKDLIAKQATAQIDTNKQKVQDIDTGSVAFKLTSKVSDNEYKISAQSQPVIGPIINEEQLKQDIRGKKRGIAESAIGSIPGVKNVRVEYKPFWVLTTPKAVKKITFVYE